MTGVAEALRRPARWLREHPLAADAALAVAIAVLAVALHLTAPDLDDDDPARNPTWWTAALVVASTLPIMFRRVRPVATLVAVAGCRCACPSPVTWTTCRRGSPCRCTGSCRRR